MTKILVVDDEPDIRLLVGFSLKRHGFEIVEATDGMTACTMAESEKPDLILMDMNMPEVDGWEATRQLKASEATRAIPVFAITAHALAGDRERALEAGCTDYHTKPVEFPKLLAQIESILKDHGSGQ